MDYRLDTSKLVTIVHKRWRSGAAIKANPPRGGGAKPMGLLLKREQVARLPKAVELLLALEISTLNERKEWGIYEGIDCATRDSDSPEDKSQKVRK